jgi:hypothetical protein
LKSFLKAYGRDKTAGVNIKVIKVLNAKPNTIDTARFDHQSTIGLPRAISLAIMS